VVPLSGNGNHAFFHRLVLGERCFRYQKDTVTAVVQSGQHDAESRPVAPTGLVNQGLRGTPGYCVTEGIPCCPLSDAMHCRHGIRVTHLFQMLLEIRFR
jgi:hypothetical protein